MVQEAMKQGAGGDVAGCKSLCSRAYELVPHVVLGKYGHGDKYVRTQRGLSMDAAETSNGCCEDFQWMLRRLPMDVQ